MSQQSLAVHALLRRLCILVRDLESDLQVLAKTGSNNEKILLVSRNLNEAFGITDAICLEHLPAARTEGRWAINMLALFFEDLLGRLNRIKDDAATIARMRPKTLPKFYPAVVARAGFEPTTSRL